MLYHIVYTNNELMPIIATFYNLIIKMHYGDNEHNPPHIHARNKKGQEGVFEIKTGIMIRGNLSLKEIKIIQDFIIQYKERLIEMWEKQNFERLKYGN